MSQSDLAKQASISTGYIGFIEAGTRSPSLSTLEKLADALNVSPYCLLLAEKDMFPFATPQLLCETRNLLEEITVRTEKLHEILDVMQKQPN